MALQVLIELVLGNVGKHFIVGLVCRAVGNPERHNEGSELRGEAPNPSGGCQQEPAQLRGHAGGTGMSPGLGTTSQSGGADARGWAVREARVRSTGTTRRGGREEKRRRKSFVSPCGKGQGGEGKDSSRAAPHKCPAFRRETRSEGFPWRVRKEKGAVLSPGVHLQAQSRERS